MVVKSEWHQVERRDGIDITLEILEEIYPDMDEDELQKLLNGLVSGETDIDELISDAWENDVELDWQYLNQDDWWTDRKGGYEITYKVEDWEYREEFKLPQTHKCTKCRWVGTRYESRTIYLNEDGSIYEEDDLEHHSTKDVCPMCDSDLELTEDGVKEEERRKKVLAEIDAIDDSDIQAEADKVFNESQKAAWPFSHESDDQNVGTPPSDEEFAEQQKALEKAFPTLPISYPPGEYKLILYGRGQEHGFSKITKTQYNFWNDRTNDLDDVFNGDYDYEENNVPKKARFDVDYCNELTDMGFYSGPDDDCIIEIKDSDNNTIIEQSLSSYVESIHTEDDYYEHLFEQNDFYVNHDLKPGYYLHWAQGGKGTYFETTITVEDGEVFDPRKLIFETTDVEGNSLVTKVTYDGEELENWGGDFSGKWGQFWLYKVEKK